MTLASTNGEELREPNTEYFDANGLRTEDPSKALAKIFTYSGGKKYFALAERRDGNLYNVTASKDDDRPYRRGQTSSFKFSQMDFSYFQMYISYLETKNDYHYNQANRYRR